MFECQTSDPSWSGVFFSEFFWYVGLWGAREIGFYYGGPCGLTVGYHATTMWYTEQIVDSKSTFIDFVII